ncbi:MAG: hypothetical protein AAF211_34215, partial [Myxococcota bacterium]
MASGIREWAIVWGLVACAPDPAPQPPSPETCDGADCPEAIACLDVEPGSLAFGALPLDGDAGRATLMLSNDCPIGVIVEDVTFSGSPVQRPFALLDLPSSRVVI